MEQLSSTTIFDLPPEIFSLIFSQLDTNTFIRINTISKEWHRLTKTEENLETRSKLEMPRLFKNMSHTWRQHYFVNSLAYKIRKIEQCRGFCIGVLGNGNMTLFDNSKNFKNALDHQYYVTAFASNGYDKCLTGSYNACLTVWKANQPEVLIQQTFCGSSYSGSVTALKWIKTNFISAGSTGNLLYWVEHQSDYILKEYIATAHKATIVCLEVIDDPWSGYGRLIMTGDADGHIKTFRLTQNPRKRVIFKGLDSIAAHASPISAMCATRIGGNMYTLITGSLFSDTINTYHVTQSGLLQPEASIPKAHQGGVREIKYLPNNFEIMTIGKDTEVKIWSRDAMELKWKCVRKITLKEEPWSIAFNENHITYIAGELGNKIIQESNGQTQSYSLDDARNTF